MNIHPTSNAPITIDGDTLETVEEFTYLGSCLTSGNAVCKDIKSRLGKNRNAFFKLDQIWKSKQYSIRTKIKLYNINVLSVLLYSSECWRAVKKEMKSLEAFHHQSLKEICRISWLQKISTAELYRKTESSSVVQCIKHRRLK